MQCFHFQGRGAKINKQMLMLTTAIPANGLWLYRTSYAELM